LQGVLRRIDRDTQLLAADCKEYFKAAMQFVVSPGKFGAWFWFLPPLSLCRMKTLVDPNVLQKTHLLPGISESTTP
jgi:heme exporter protein D